MGKIKNRWLIALSSVCIHLSIGSVYAYSVMVNPLKELNSWSKGNITLAFSIAILSLGLSAAFLGSFAQKLGPKKSGSFSAFMYGLGMIMVGFFAGKGNLPMFIVSYGIIAGLGLGIGYITPVSILISWFPDRRGLASGMAIMGFGFSSMIFGPVMTKLFTLLGVPNTFYVLGGVYFLIILLSSLYLEAPPENWAPKDYTPKNPKEASNFGLTVNQVLKTDKFYIMWAMFFINITCGIAIISVASPLAQDVLLFSPMAAAAMVGVMGLFNGLGRIGWATLSDKIGRSNIFKIFFILQIGLFLILPNISNPVLFQLIIFVIISCYGGGFSTIPAYIGDLFGTKNLGSIYGAVLTAWGASGIMGPTIVARIKDSTGSYSLTLQIFSGLFVIALILSYILGRSKKTE